MSDVDEPSPRPTHQRPSRPTRQQQPSPAQPPSPTHEQLSRIAHEPVRELRERLRESRFGPSALATPANAITLARLLATPVLVILVAVGGPGWAPFAVALVIGLTDSVDGWIARRQGATRSGAFLDPLADKVVVVSALFVLAAKGMLGWLPVALIAAREVAMSAYRVHMGRRGVSIPARRSAKVKTLVQGIAILLALVPQMTAHKGAVAAVLWVAVAFTLVTGVQYLLDGRRAARAAAAGTDRVAGGGTPGTGPPAVPPVSPGSHGTAGGPLPLDIQGAPGTPVPPVSPAPSATPPVSPAPPATGTSHRASPGTSASGPTRR